MPEFLFSLACMVVLALVLCRFGVAKANLQEDGV